MSERRFTVLHPVASFVKGDRVAIGQLTGCNVDALVASGHLRETKAKPTTRKPTATGG